MLIIKNDKRIEYALKEYRRKVKDTKLMDDIKSNREFKKKSQIKRDRLNKAKYIQKKNENKGF
jgi:small subunit ribosomal protein S21